MLKLYDNSGWISILGYETIWSLELIQLVVVNTGRQVVLSATVFGVSYDLSRKTLSMLASSVLGRSFLPHRISAVSALA